MYLSVFMIKDNYGKFQNIVNALVENKMVSTYMWILQCLMKAMNNTVLKAFWTDSELELINAATYIFPKILHFYCLFHIWQNITTLKPVPITSNSASNLCEIENTIDKRHEDEFQYCKLVNLKAHQITVGLPYLSSQFFSSIDIILNYFLMPLNLDIKTASDNFIEDIIDESQITIKSLLSGIKISNIIEIWKIRCIGSLSCKYNIVILLDDGNYLCICLETITKGIICQHFWRVMLYSNSVKFHIIIIPVRWYKDSILTNLNINLKNFLILTAIETTTDTSTLSQITSCTFQSLHCIQRSDNNEVICQNTNQRNRFGIVFSIVKTAVNIALKTNSDRELIQLLKDFIKAKREKNVDNNDNVNHDIVEINESNQENDNIVPLQKNLIKQITSFCVTKVKGIL
ncbi:hypothetical protein RhiirC2_774061 [Rhizophagus irregularis]|uniref:SWIM-type domain-containing protein n=1 Tax=Rhizophagus irregularis TaxID=588596 RepID=A0A2N1NMH7_9GLOM|nr:hypothetical protein RhiirC2_774061 [Rhizophagus irregularis]